MEIKTKNQKPTGLHQKYYVHKINQMDGSHEPINTEAEYFVLRLDENCEKKHLEACRKAIMTYAVSIEPFLPHLAKDLIERYGNS